MCYNCSASGPRDRSRSIIITVVLEVLADVNSRAGIKREYFVFSDGLFPCLGSNPASENSYLDGILCSR
jgi:hypothetical protein